ncbi:MAG: formylglycine-generating enzyme family protein [Candidatus Nanoarchaeia archaeon]
MKKGLEFILAGLLSCAGSFKPLPDVKSVEFEGMEIRTERSSLLPSLKEASEDACINARTRLAVDIKNAVTSRSFQVSSVRGTELNEGIAVVTDVNQIGVKTDDVQCIPKEEYFLGLFKEVQGYECSCSISMSKGAYDAQVVREREKELLGEVMALIKTEKDSFYIAKNEVTIGEFAVYLRMNRKEYYETKCKKGKSFFNFKLDLSDEKIFVSKYPMRCVSQEDAGKYCKRFWGELPLEEEWMAAAGSAKFPWGEEEPTNPPVKTNFGHRINENALAPVRSYPLDVSSSGVFDLGGNVAEWVKEKEVVKGGAWGLPLRYCEIETRSRETVPSIVVGFRCVLRP